MKKYILRIDSLVKTFSIIETGKDISFNYQEKEKTSIFSSIKEGDAILGYYSKPSNQVSCIFTVKHVNGADSVVLNKTLEVSEGVTLEASMVDVLELMTIIEIPEDYYRDVVRALLAGVDEKKRSFPKADEQEEKFSVWLNGLKKADGSRFYAETYCYKLVKIANKYKNIGRLKLIIRRR